MMSIQTPIGIFSSKRLLQVGTDCWNHFQAVRQENYEGHVGIMLQRIEDFLFFGKDETYLIKSIPKFLCICKEIGVKLLAEKSNLFYRQVKFCGRIISTQGVEYHPQHFNSMVKILRPSKAHESKQFLFVTNWMRNAIPAYAERIAPLKLLLEDTYKITVKGTKNAVINITITNSWGTEHDTAFDDIKKNSLLP